MYQEAAEQTGDEKKPPISLKNPVGWIVVVVSILVGVVLLIGAISGWSVMFS